MMVQEVPLLSTFYLLEEPLEVFMEEIAGKLFDEGSSGIFFFDLCWERDLFFIV